MGIIVCIRRVSRHMKRKYHKECRSLSYAMVRKFLSDLKEECSEWDNKIIKIEELKKIEQWSRTMEKFVQDFRRIVRESGYERRLLVEEFKWRINGVIQQKIIESEYPPRVWSNSMKEQ